MAFSTWDLDCGHSPNWESLEVAISALVDLVNTLAGDLQAPADAAVAHAEKVRLHIRRHLDKTTGKLVQVVQADVGEIASCLQGAADVRTAEAAAMCGATHGQLLGAGLQPPALPPSAGSPLSAVPVPSGPASVTGGVDPVTGGPLSGQGRLLAPVAPPSSADASTIAQDGAPEPLADEGESAITYPQGDSATGIDVYTDAPGSIGVRESIPLPSGPSAAAGAPSGAQPVDFDQANVLLLAESEQPWHRRLKAFYAPALDTVLGAATILDVIQAREQQLQDHRAADPWAYLTDASSAPFPS